MNDDNGLLLVVFALTILLTLFVVAPLAESMGWWR